jgi:uncharacterized protein (TIGR02145 family)
MKRVGFILAMILIYNSVFSICIAKDKEIETITIGYQIWMKYNLNVDHYINGDSIPEVRDIKKWSKLTTGAWCYYNNDPNNGRIYGKLYNWYAIHDKRGLIPIGWHLPSGSEWHLLYDTNFDVKKFIILGGSLNCTYQDRNNFSFYRLGKHGWWWLTKNDQAGVYNSMGFYLYDIYAKQDGYSVRCIKD